MTVSLRLRAPHPARTDYYPGVVGVRSDGKTLSLIGRGDTWRVPLAAIAEIRLDDDPGGL